MLVSAFVSLAQRERYDDIRICDILAVSGVSRSTFYEHFHGKHALLATSMGDAMGLLAGVSFGHTTSDRLTKLLAHFWTKRALLRSMLRGIALRAVRNALIVRIEATFEAEPYALSLPPRLAANVLADGMLSPIIAWLSGEAACNVPALATALDRASAATLAGMVD